MKWLQIKNIEGVFLQIFTRRNNFCYFLVASLDNRTLTKHGLLSGGRLAPKGVNYFLQGLKHTEKGNRNENSMHTSADSIPFDIKTIMTFLSYLNSVFLSIFHIHVTHSCFSELPSVLLRCRKKNFVKSRNYHTIILSNGVLSRKGLNILLLHICTRALDKREYLMTIFLISH